MFCNNHLSRFVIIKAVVICNNCLSEFVMWGFNLENEGDASPLDHSPRGVVREK